MIVEHVAIWVRDLEPMRAFYTEALGGTNGDLYENPATGLRSYFVSLGAGARLELMYRPAPGPSPSDAVAGYAHIALALGSRDAVDAAVAALRQRGVPIGVRAPGDRGWLLRGRRFGPRAEPGGANGLGQPSPLLGDYREVIAVIWYPAVKTWP